MTAALAAIGIATEQWWLAVLGVAAALLATGGLLFENYDLKGKA